MLIHRQVVDSVVILGEVVAEPVGKLVLMRFTVSPNSRRLSAAPPQPELLEMARQIPRLQRRPRARFAEARMPHDGDFFGVNFTVGLEVIEAAANPHAQVAMLPIHWASVSDKAGDAVGETVIVIGVDIAVVDRREVAAAEDLFKRVVARLVGEALFDTPPAIDLVLPGSIPRPVVGDAVTPGVSHPRFGDGDRGVRVNEVIVEIDHQKSGHRAVGVFGMSRCASGFPLSGRR